MTKELIVEYYDKNYKKPRGDPLATYEVPPGLILAPEELFHSPLLEQIVELGNEYLRNLDNKEKENFGMDQINKLQSISDIKTSECQETLKINSAKSSSKKKGI